MGRWDDRPEDSSDDWRGWTGGKYDNRYQGNEHRGSYRNSYKKKHSKNLGIGIGIGVAVVGIALAFVFGIVEVPEVDLEQKTSQLTLQKIDQTWNDCVMSTFGTRNVEIQCGNDIFHLVRELPLNANVVHDVTLTVKNNVYTTQFVSPLGIEIKYDLIDVNYEEKVYDDLEKILDEIKLSSDVSESLESIGDSLTEVPLMVENIIHETQDSVVIPDVKIPEIEAPKIETPEIEMPSFEPPKQPTLQELRQIALDDINKYRQEHGVRPISLGNAKAPQVYAEELAQEQCIHHISDSGDGPMLRYKNHNDRMYLIFENIAGGYGSTWDMEGGILDANYDMMFDDAHANWGHRDNIINPSHESVSIGITYDSGELVIVQDFEQSLPSGYLYHPSSFKKQPVDQKFCW